MTVLDWAILLAMYVLIVGCALMARPYMRSVADFLAAGRSAGRYLLTVSAGIAALGAITVVANLELGLEAGFAIAWWGIAMSLLMMIVTASGWVNYRFRRTRSLTLAEFFQRRYSRRFRIFTGVIAFSAGLVNFGIFPAVGARFFMYFCGLPESFSLLGISLPTFETTMAILLITAVSFVFTGGQVAVMITDFIQGSFANVVMVVVTIYLLVLVGWPQVTSVMLDVDQGHSKINPFDTTAIEDFNIMYFMIGIVGYLYSAMSWQGTQAYNTSALTAHEGKMGNVLGLWRGMPQAIFMLLVPILIYTILHHPRWTTLQSGLAADLATVENDALRAQMMAPLVLARLLPTGLLGCFAAFMLAAFISTHNTYLHSWSSIFIQDVVMPFRKKPFSQESHLLLLRLSCVGVAFFIFVFSSLYRQTEAILLFFALTGAIFAGWSGAVVIGGLYTRWGQTAGAWGAGIVGVALAVAGLVVAQANASLIQTGVAFWGLLDWIGAQRALNFANWMNDNGLNGQEIWGLAMPVCTAVYIVLSMVAFALTRRRFNLDQLLHRGQYEISGEIEHPQTDRRNLWRWIGITSEFSRRDVALYLVTYAWNIGWIIVFVVGTIYFLTRRITDGDWSAFNGLWLGFWEVYVWVFIIVSAIVVVWFTIGGFRDLRNLLNLLKTRERDEADDGTVRENES